MSSIACPLRVNDVTCSTSSTSLKFATFNVRGLATKFKREQLGRDLLCRGIHLAAIQETKCDASDEQLPTGQRLILLGHENKQHGIGFCISKELQPFVDTYTKLSDRVATLDVEIPCRKSNNTTKIRFICAYGPTLALSTRNPLILDDFYDQLSQAWCKGRICVCAGDFNSKIGAKKWRLPEDEGTVGSWGKGQRNANGQHLVDYCHSVGAVVANTLFKKKLAKTTTWKGKNSDGTRPVYNQIDFLLVPKA